MKLQITTEELVSKGFLDEAKRKELEEYVRARQGFLHKFVETPAGSGIKALVQRCIEAAMELSRASDELRDGVRSHAEFLEKEILPLIRVLADGEEREKLERGMAEFQAAVQHEVRGPSVTDWAAAVLAQKEQLDKQFEVLRARLERPQEEQPAGAKRSKR